MSDIDWLRRYEANRKVPGLPADDDDFDHAMSELRMAVDEIAPDAVGALSAVVRILRHRRGLAAQVLHMAEPTCLGCGGDKKCLGCDDVRPVAEGLDVGWRFVSSLGRWETVDRVEQASQYAPVRVWTDATGPDYSWLIPRWRKVHAVAPPLRWHGTPEIRIVEYQYARDAPMYAVTTLDTVRHVDPATEDHLVQACYSRESGWQVVHRPDGGGDLVVVDCGRSKAKARTALWAVAREHARALGVRVAVEAREAAR